MAAPSRILIDAVATHAGAAPHRVALVDLATELQLTYAQFDDLINRCAALLQQRLGAAKGERIAMLSRNSAALVIVQYACIRAGAIFQPLNWRLTPAEIEPMLEDAQPSLFIWEADFDDVAEKLIGRFGTDRRFRIAPADNELFKAMDKADMTLAPPPRAPVDPEAPVALLYTSGTSGRPKGVIITERMVLFSAINYCLSTHVNHQTVFLCDMPLFHVSGLLAAVRSTVFAGGKVLISQKFDSEITLRRLMDEALGVTHYFCVTQMASLLWQRPEFDAKRLRKLVLFGTGGAPNPPAAVRRWVADGIHMVDGYGMTESGSSFNMPPDDLELIARKAGSCGLPSLCTEVRLVGEDGQDVADGEVGEIWMRGPSISPGYWNRPEETAKTFAGGWLHTGDAAYRDADGFYYIVDRTKDMYISGGENVYPAEVEAAMAELPEIAEAAVIGVPDRRWGEVGVAYVILAEGASLDEAAIIAHCRSRLARYKVPTRIILTTDIPHTASGKIQKHLLRERWQEEQAGTTD